MNNEKGFNKIVGIATKFAQLADEKIQGFNERNSDYFAVGHFSFEKKQKENKQFDYESEDRITSTEEKEKFRIKVYYLIINSVISAMKIRFEKYVRCTLILLVLVRRILPK